MKFSIITINYNNCAGLRSTIESVVGQTCREFEYIVIDGGSTDGSLEVIKKYSEKIDYWISEPDSGVYNAMNKGIAVARGDYCNFMNSGDVFYANDVLDKVIKHSKNEDVVYGDISYAGKVVWPNPEKLTMKFFYKNSLYHQACFIKSGLLKMKPYDEELKIISDWKWFLEMIVFKEVSYAHVPIVVCTFEGGGISSNKRLVYEEQNVVLRQLLPSIIFDDYKDYAYGITPYRRMFTTVENIPPFMRLLYRIDVLVLKLLNLRYHSSWIKDLPWSIDK